MTGFLRLLLINLTIFLYLNKLLPELASVFLIMSLNSVSARYANTVTILKELKLTYQHGDSDL